MQVLQAADAAEPTEPPTGLCPLKTQLAVPRQKRGTLTATPQHLLQCYYRQGHWLAKLTKTMLPYALPLHNDISDAEWQHQVGWFSHSKYLQDMDAIYAERAALRFDAFYRTNPIKAFQEG